MNLELPAILGATGPATKLAFWIIFTTVGIVMMVFCRRIARWTNGAQKMMMGELFGPRHDRPPVRLPNSRPYEVFVATLIAVWGLMFATAGILGVVDGVAGL
jgi:hypothetical protein